MLTGTDNTWFYWPMLGAGLCGGLFGADWERRQIAKYLESRTDDEDRGDVSG
jgi:hypothetical protein